MKKILETVNSKITKQNINKFSKSIVKKVLSTLTILYFLSINLYAESIQNSKLTKGTEKLLDDALTALLIIIPIAAGLFGAYFGIRLGMADEQDKKTWANRLKILGVGFVIAITSTGLIKMLASYYK